MEIAVIEVHGTSDLKQWVELPNALSGVTSITSLRSFVRNWLFFAREEPVV